jgi:hypothetical protein
MKRDQRSREYRIVEPNVGATEFGAIKIDPPSGELHITKESRATRELRSAELHKSGEPRASESGDAAREPCPDKAGHAVESARGFYGFECCIQEFHAITREYSVPEYYLAACEMRPGKVPPSKWTPVKSKSRPCHDTGTPSRRCAVMALITV